MQRTHAVLVKKEHGERGLHYLGVFPFPQLVIEIIKTRPGIPQNGTRRLHQSTPTGRRRPPHHNQRRGHPPQRHPPRQPHRHHHHLAQQSQRTHTHNPRHHTPPHGHRPHPGHGDHPGERVGGRGGSCIGTRKNLSTPKGTRKPARSPSNHIKRSTYSSQKHPPNKRKTPPPTTQATL